MVDSPIVNSDESWKTFFDTQYLEIAGQMMNDEVSEQQAGQLWSMLDLEPGCRILDAPCGHGRLSRPLAALGAIVLGVDHSEVLLEVAERRRGDLPIERLRYQRHDLRVPLAETGFDVACNIFTSFGYGAEEEDFAMFRSLRAAVRPGGRVVVETNHRDLVCATLARGQRMSMRMPDGTIFVDDPKFDAIAGIVTLNWYWWGPTGAGEKHLRWRCYSPTQIVKMLEDAGLQFAGAYKGLSKTPFESHGPDVGGRIAIVATREE
jgi:SAM-dependent methyltransferase